MKKFLIGAAIAAALASTQAQAAMDKIPWNEALTLSGGVDVVSSYVFRGYEYQDSGYIVQPWAQLNATAWECGDTYSLTPYIGVWGDIQEEEQPGDKHLWETDYYAGVDFRMADWTLGAIYTLYSAPGDAFDDIYEFGLRLSYNDSKLAKKVGLPVALQPYVAWYKETSDQNVGGSQDQYGEVGLVPSLTIDNFPLRFTFPIAAGLSVDDYYFDKSGNNELLGFVSAGAYAFYDLPWGERFGTWTLYGGGTYYFLNADSAKLASGEDRDYEIVGKVGLSFTY